MKAEPGAAPVAVTQSTLPPLEDYLSYVRQIFASHQLTNQSRFTQQLERELAAFLGAQTLIATANGTLALQLAIRHLGLAGKKVITTPFTYVATISALLWEGCEPVFADINPETLCLDPASVSDCLASHPDAAAILPVHVFGNAVDVAGMAEIAQEHQLKLLYDAAHAFGSKLDGHSLFTFGDAAIGSFHSTKLFHTVEGGCIVTPKKEDAPELALLRAFGHVNDDHRCLGINAKLSELHAAMGLALLPAVPDLIQKRAQKTSLYDSLLGLPEAQKPFCTIRLAPGLEWNHAYYPLIFENGVLMRKALAALDKENIHPRRYFYPSLTQLPYIRSQKCAIAEDIASRIVCLPLWPDMDDAIIAKTAGIILAASGI